MWRVFVPRVTRALMAGSSSTSVQQLCRAADMQLLNNVVTPCSISSTQHPNMLHGFKHYSIAADAFAKEVEEINNLFVQAREEIDYAKEDSETVYFNESVAEAKELVDTCLGRWEALLGQLDEQERSKLQRSMGLKMEQLKAEFDLVAKLHLEE